MYEGKEWKEVTNVQPGKNAAKFNVRKQLQGVSELAIPHLAICRTLQDSLCS